jgi:hypothetical protein
MKASDWPTNFPQTGQKGLAFEKSRGYSSRGKTDRYRGYFFGVSAVRARVNVGTEEAVLATVFTDVVSVAGYFEVNEPVPKHNYNFSAHINHKSTKLCLFNGAMLKIHDERE